MELIYLFLKRWEDSSGLNEQELKGDWLPECGSPGNLASFWQMSFIYKQRTTAKMWNILKLVNKQSGWNQVGSSNRKLDIRDKMKRIYVTVFCCKGHSLIQGWGWAVRWNGISFSRPWALLMSFPKWKNFPNTPRHEIQLIETMKPWLDREHRAENTMGTNITILKLKRKNSWTWWYMPVILALMRLKQEDSHEFEDKITHIQGQPRPHLKSNSKNRKRVQKTSSDQHKLS